MQKFYSEVRIIHTSNAQKIVRIVWAYFMLSNIMLWRVASRTIMQIIQEMRISEG